MNCLSFRCRARQDSESYSGNVECLGSTISSFFLIWQLVTANTRTEPINFAVAIISLLTQTFSSSSTSDKAEKHTHYLRHLLEHPVSVPEPEFDLEVTAPTKSPQALTSLQDHGIVQQRSLFLKLVTFSSKPLLKPIMFGWHLCSDYVLELVARSPRNTSIDHEHSDIR